VSQVARRVGARRAADDDALLAEFDLLEDEGDKISVAALVKQGVTAVLVACLGLFVVGAVSAASAPYSTAVATDSSGISGSADVTRAQPGTSTDQTDIGVSAADTSGTDADLSRSAVRSEFTNAVAAQQESARGVALSDTAAQVSEAAQTSAADQRAAALNSTNTAITTEAQRAAEAAAQAAAEKKLGTLVTSSSNRQPVAIDPSILAALATIDASAPWVSPIAPGSYVRGAVFGEYGSWSRYHTGVDLDAAYGTPIRAAGSGVVVASDGGSWAGTHVVIMHADGSRTLYAHMSAKVAQPGTVVRAGQLIGYVGMTGRAFGYHCHFEYYPPSATVGDPYTALDPLPFLLKHGVTI
jgi:murein DD-endopeptidase MepM/ murein hydrolase activator NlpD